jgi:hypothetical protein
MQPVMEQLNLAISGDRVRAHTAPFVNQRIDELMLTSVDEHVREGREGIVRRLAELDAEWDIDRALMVNFAIVGGLTFALGLSRYASSPLLGRKRKRLLYLFGSQLGFMLMHGLIGWCPPVSVLRRLGSRTAREIDQERSALLGALQLENERSIETEPSRL